MKRFLDSHLEGIPFRQGKVRDIYDLGDTLIIVASDRISAFDWVLPTPIPDKGKILTQISRFWFEFLQIDNHIIDFNVNNMPSPFPSYADRLQDRTMWVKKTKVVPIECVARGYLSGSGWKDYLRSGKVCGLDLPANLQEGEQLPNILFTPATKAESGHDENIAFEEMKHRVGSQLADQLREKTISIYNQASQHLQKCGIILADTKFEFGQLGTEKILLIDEVLTPDSSRFWPADRYQIGRAQPSYDKQFVRDWLETTGWDKNSPPPELPMEVVNKTREKYLEIMNLILGRSLNF